MINIKIEKLNNNIAIAFFQIIWKNMAIKILLKFFK